MNDCETLGSDSGIETSCDSAASSSALASKRCKLNDLKGKAPEKIEATFWPEDWRKQLCKCSSCVKIYDEKKLSFLLDEKDGVHYYEKMGKEQNTKVSQYDKGLSALQNMPRVAQVEALHGKPILNLLIGFQILNYYLEYNNFKSELTDYLKKFAESGKVVREEDIKEFFETMKSRKRPRLDIPYNCR